MSALGQKQTFPNVRAMSALPPKADIQRHDWNVRFVPKADITHCSNFLLLFDLPVGAANQRKRYARAECLSGFQMKRWKNFYPQELQV
jgi:hypothetical protein